MPTGMTPTQELVRQVRSAADGGPYVVRERPYGFDLTVDVVDARWWSLLRLNSLHRVFTHEVHVDEADRTIRITDVAHTLEWEAGRDADGPPRLRADGAARGGRLHELSLHEELGAEADTDEPGSVVDYTFSAAEGHELIHGVASRAGWSERLGPDLRFGLAVAGVTLAAVLVAGLVAIVISRAG